MPTTERHRPLWQIAQDIRRAWPKVNYAAEPYLRAMSRMDQIVDNYGYDEGTSIVRYFLANARAFRGDTAKALKSELKTLAGIK